MTDETTIGAIRALDERRQRFDDRRPERFDERRPERFDDRRPEPVSVVRALWDVMPERR